MLFDFSLGRLLLIRGLLVAISIRTARIGCDAVYVLFQAIGLVLAPYKRSSAQPTSRLISALRSPFRSV